MPDNNLITSPAYVVFLIGGFESLALDSYLSQRYELMWEKINESSNSCWRVWH